MCMGNSYTFHRDIGQLHTNSKISYYKEIKMTFNIKCFVNAWYCFQVYFKYIVLEFHSNDTAIICVFKEALNSF